MNSEDRRPNPELFGTETEAWQQQLDELGLDTERSVVIGSGIMQALGLRRSRDLDLVVSFETYQRLSSRADLAAGETCGLPVLAGDGLEIFWYWSAVGDERDFDYLKGHSVVIEAIRYISLEFLLGVKEGWVATGEDRPKDHDDIDMIRDYLAYNRV